MRTPRIVTVALAGLLAACVWSPAPVSAEAVSDWVTAFGDENFDGSVVVESLPGGDVLVLAKHGFGPGGGTSVRRLSTTGAVEWVREIPDPSTSGFYGSEFRSALTLADGRVLFAGYSDADGSPDALFDAVILAVNPSTGDTTTVTWGGPAKDMLDHLAQCADGTVYAVGSSWDGATSPDETRAIGGTDIFVTRLDESLQRGWTRQIGSHRNDAVFSVRCGEDGSIDLNAWAAGRVNGQGSDDHYNFFTARISPAGATVRTIVTGLDHGEWSPGGGTHAPDGSYYVTGESNGMYPDMQCTEWAIGGSFVAKYSPDGELLWRTILPCANQAGRIVIGRSGDLFVAGGANSRRIAGQPKFGEGDWLLHRYSPDGTRLWTRQFGSELDDAGGSISVDDRGGVIFGGYTRGTYAGHTPVGGWDAVVTRFDVDDQPTVLPTGDTPVAVPGTVSPTTLPAVPEPVVAVPGGNPVSSVPAGAATAPVHVADPSVSPAPTAVLSPPAEVIPAATPAKPAPQKATPRKTPPKKVVPKRSVLSSKTNFRNQPAPTRTRTVQTKHSSHGSWQQQSGHPLFRG